jgi:hypothetical protein
MCRLTRIQVTEIWLRKRSGLRLAAGAIEILVA